MNKPVMIEGREYPVIDRLGYQQSAGVYAIEVRDGDCERIAVSPSARGPWRWHQVQILVGPPPCGQSSNA